MPLKREKSVADLESERSGEEEVVNTKGKAVLMVRRVDGKHGDDWMDLHTAYTCLGLVLKIVTSRITWHREYSAAVDAAKVRRARKQEWEVGAKKDLEPLFCMSEGEKRRAIVVNRLCEFLVVVTHAIVHLHEVYPPST